MTPRSAYFDRLLKILGQKGLSREDAEDLVQVAMLRLHVYARNAVVYNEEALLRRAACNLSVDQYRRNRPDLYRHVSIDDVRLDAGWVPCSKTVAAAA